MAISLFDISVTSYLQALSGISGVLEKSVAHFREQRVDLEEVVQTRLIADMHPFRFQVQSMAYHSVGALESLRIGTFQPPKPHAEVGYEALQALIVEARETLQNTKREEVDALEGKELIFKGSTVRTYTAEAFLLSFSLPNFYFHATTTYAILRMKGAPIGKRDYIGPARLTLGA